MSGAVSATAVAAGTAGTAAAAGSTLATIGTVASIAAGGLGVFGAIQQGQAAKSSANYNAAVAANNAKIADQNAKWAAAEGNANVEAKQLETRQKVAAMKTAQAANGVDINSGSALDVRTSAAELGELDALNIRANSARKVYGYETQSSNATAQSQLDKSEGKNAATAGYVGGATTLLGTVGDNWDSFSAPKNTFDTSDLNYGSEATYK